MDMDIRIKDRQGIAVDIETRRKKQRDLIVNLVERKVRSRAQQLYDERGQEEGQALKDWVQAESEVVGNSVLAPMYRRLKSSHQNPEESNPELSA